MKHFNKRLAMLVKNHERLIKRTNRAQVPGNGIYQKFRHPVLTREHTPLFWRYDLDQASNPLLLERNGINGTFNPGAIIHNGKVNLVVRVEGADRKSFFAIAESGNGIDGFCFRPRPLSIPQTGDPDINVYDMRLTRHQDGWIYGIFCTERKDKKAPVADTSAADAQAGIVRTRDLETWERLPDLKTPSAQQRNVVLHPEFVDGKYALYTRPQDGFIDTGSGGGIGWGLCSTMENAVIDQEHIVDYREYHTIKESKNGQGPAPIKTAEGWIHIAHGVRNTAAGLRYVIYLFMTELKRPWIPLYQPAGHFIYPEGAERTGDVSNVVFTNGAVCRDNGEVLIYYASSDTRCHVARTSVDLLLDYCKNTKPDPLNSADCVWERINLIDSNLALLSAKNSPLLRRALQEGLPRQ